MQCTTSPDSRTYISRNEFKMLRMTTLASLMFVHLECRFTTFLVTVQSLSGISNRRALEFAE